MVLEKTVVANFRKAIHDLGGLTIKTHGSNYMVHEPDIMGCLYGFFFVAEAKRDANQKMTRGQTFRLEQWKEAGAIAFTFYDWKLAKELLLSEIEVKKSKIYHELFMVGPDNWMNGPLDSIMIQEFQNKDKID